MLSIILFVLFSAQSQLTTDDNTLPLIPTIESERCAPVRVVWADSNRQHSRAKTGKLRSEDVEFLAPVITSYGCAMQTDKYLVIATALADSVPDDYIAIPKGSIIELRRFSGVEEPDKKPVPEPKKDPVKL